MRLSRSGRFRSDTQVATGTDTTGDSRERRTATDTLDPTSDAPQTGTGATTGKADPPPPLQETGATSTGSDPEAGTATVKPKAPFVRDFSWTMLTTALIGVAVIILNADLARRGATTVFGPIAYAKRMAGMITPAVSLCAYMGVIRFVAGGADENERRHARVGAIGLVLLACLLFTAVIAVFGPALSAITMLEPLPLLWATWAYSVSMILNGLSYSLRRAELRQATANWINLWANALVPVIVVVFVPRTWSASLILLAISIPVLIWHAGELIAISIRNARDVEGWSGFAGVTRRVSLYSLARIPASLGVSAMFAIGPFLAARQGVAEDGAMSGLLAALAFVSIASYSLQAVGIVVLPRASALGADNKPELRVMATRLLTATLLLPLLLVPSALILAPEAVTVWLGEGFAPAIPLVRIVLVAVPAVLAQVLLRGVIDGASDRAWNAYAMVAGVVVTLVGSLLSHDAVGLAFAFTAGAWITGLVTIAAVRLGFHAPVGVRAWLVSITLGVVLAATSWIATLAVTGSIARLAVAIVLALPFAVLPFLKWTPVYKMLWARRKVVSDDV